jgi:prevent-host-death family protein
MRRIELKDAKAMLSSLVDEAVDGEPSAITRRGKPVAIILGLEEWEWLRRAPSFGRLLMSAPISASDLPKRRRSPIRPARL